MEEKVKHKLKNLLRRFSHGQNDQKHFPFSTLSPRNVAGLDNRGKFKRTYYIEVAVLIDAGVWDLFSNLMQTNFTSIDTRQVERKIREFFSHIINGVNLLYRGIEYNRIEFMVTLRDFHIFRKTCNFPHKKSMLQTVDGNDYIDAEDYIFDLSDLIDRFSTGSDHVMLFTRYDMYVNSTGETNVKGYSFMEKVCDRYYKTSSVQVRDYFSTVATAAHQLAHNLGADHDGEGNAKACKAEDLFLMSSHAPQFDKGAPYSRNPWIFSNCSKRVFKNMLKTKKCVTSRGAYYDLDEWKKLQKKLPGKVYSLNEQCELINGPNSVFCGTESADICRFMECTDPKTGQCKSSFSTAARGTRCGENMWCKEGLCVSEA